MANTTIAVECPKCSGTGYIMAFGHVANGVCFCCKGSRTVEINAEAKKAKLSDTTRKQGEWILSSTEASYKGLSFAKLSKIRDFAYCGFGMQEAFPGLLAHYREVGEAAFFAAQERHLEAYYANS